MVEIAATVFVLVVAHIYIRAYLGWQLFGLIVGGLFLLFCGLVAVVFFPTHILVIAGGIALAAGLQAAGVLNRPAEWGKGKRIV